MMHGIDISGHQPADIPALVPSDFCIVKATGGSGYRNPAAAQQIGHAQDRTHRTGLYHFAGDGYPWTTPEAEAQHFLDTWGALAGQDTVPVLDWEESGRTQETGWAHRWIEVVAAASGKVPLLYCNLSVASANDWQAVQGLGVKLWLAMYGDDSPVAGYAPPGDLPAVGNGWADRLAMWQYTQHGVLPGYGGELDLNVAYEDLWAGVPVAVDDLIDGVAGVDS